MVSSKAAKRMRRLIGHSLISQRFNQTLDDILVSYVHATEDFRSVRSESFVSRVQARQQCRRKGRSSRTERNKYLGRLLLNLPRLDLDASNISKRRNLAFGESLEQMR